MEVKDEPDTLERIKLDYIAECVAEKVIQKMKERELKYLDVIRQTVLYFLGLLGLKK